MKNWWKLYMLVGILSNMIGSVQLISSSPHLLEKLRSIRQWLDTTQDATAYDYIYRVNKGAGLNLFEGDIKGYNPKHSQLKTAITDHQLLWNTRIVPYIIDSQYDSASRKDILAAFAEYHSKTCLRFVPRTTEMDYVNIRPISGCYSDVGRMGGGQEISLAGPCLKKGTAIHELMHALGFWHEQSRPDRDSWVQIIRSNIQTGKDYNFDKLPSGEVDTLGEQYDYGSVMHYSKYAFSKNGNPTIIPTRQTNAELGQREGLSEHDVHRINILYRCDTKLSSAQQDTGPKATTKTVSRKTLLAKTTNSAANATTKALLTRLLTTIGIQPSVHDTRTLYPTIITPSQTNLNVLTKLLIVPQPAYVQKPTRMFISPEPTSIIKSPTKQTVDPQLVYVQKPTRMLISPEPTPITNSPTTKPTIHPQPVNSQKPTRMFISPEPTSITTSPMTKQTVNPQPVNSQKPTRMFISPEPTSITTSPMTKQTVNPQPVNSQKPTRMFISPEPTSITTSPMTKQTVNPHSFGWTIWSHWSPCDLECRHSRYRFCMNYDSHNCPGQNSDSRHCAFPCKRAVAMGCWKEDSTLPAIPSVEYQDTLLNDTYKYRTEAVRKCSDFAAKKGYIVFAVFDGGMCRTGASAYINYSHYGPSRECNYRGTGSKDASNVYSFYTDINGGWSSWTEWSVCTKTCGMGRRYRYRTCDNPAPFGNGTQCSGQNRDVAICNLTACEADVKCGTQFYTGDPGTSGMIWVRDYDNFMECEYLIFTLDPSSTISLLIQDIDIEYSRGCIYDSLMVYDGEDSLSPFVGAFCGHTSPGSFESTTNNVYLRFESDETNTGNGFTVFYTINSKSKKACVRPPASAHVTITSNGNMVGDSVMYQCYPGYTIVGHSNITCVDQPGFALWNDVYPRCILARKRSVRNTEEKWCFFETSLCGFKNYNQNNFDWRVKLFVNNSVLYVESTHLQRPGDISRILSGELHPGHGTNCINFRYSIDGGLDAVLNIYIIYLEHQNTKTNSTLIWSAHGTFKENLSWQHGIIEIQSEEKFHVMLEAVLWEELGSSIAIDDIRISREPCIN